MATTKKTTQPKAPREPDLYYHGIKIPELPEAIYGKPSPTVLALREAFLEQAAKARGKRKPS